MFKLSLPIHRPPYIASFVLSVIPGAEPPLIKADERAGTKMHFNAEQ